MVFSKLDLLTKEITVPFRTYLDVRALVGVFLGHWVVGTQTIGSNGQRWTAVGHRHRWCDEMAHGDFVGQQ